MGIPADMSEQEFDAFVNCIKENQATFDDFLGELYGGDMYNEVRAQLFDLCIGATVERNADTLGDTLEAAYDEYCERVAEEQA